MTEQTLRKPEFTKLKDLENGRSGYNVYVRVVKAEKKEVPTKDGKSITMINAVVSDQTGSANAFFKGPQSEFIEKDNVIAIRNGVKRIVKGHISLQVDAFGRVTKENLDIKTNEDNNISQVEIKFERQRKNFGKRPYNNRNFNNRGNDRTRRNDDRPPRRNDRNQDDRPPRRSDRNQDRRNDRNQDRRNDRNEDRRNDRNQDERPPRRNYQNRQNESYNRGYNNDRRGNRERDQDFDRRPKRQNKNYEDRSYRNYQGSSKNYEERRQQFREKRAPLQWTKINQINPGQDNLNLIAKVISATIVKGARNNVRCVIGDQTGIVNAFLATDSQISVGSSIALFKAESKVVKEHIQIQFGRSGRVETARKSITEVNDSFNLSNKSWVAVD